MMHADRLLGPEHASNNGHSASLLTQVFLSHHDSKSFLKDTLPIFAITLYALGEALAHEATGGRAHVHVFVIVSSS